MGFIYRNKKAWLLKVWQQNEKDIARLHSLIKLFQNNIQK